MAHRFSDGTQLVENSDVSGRPWRPIRRALLSAAEFIGRSLRANFLARPASGDCFHSGAMIKGSNRRAQKPNQITSIAECQERRSCVSLAWSLRHLSGAGGVARP